MDNIQEKETNKDMWTDEERENIVGFFDLLLKIDKCHNPQKYVRKNKKGSIRVL